jgi:phenylacetate-coenzyme A ligase PaaK-like adenylate-forming protein
MVNEAGMTVHPPSSVPGIAWPALPAPPTAMLLAVHWQLERSQWWSADELAARQAVQRRGLLAHAAATVPHYAGLDPDDWASVPILSRDALIAAGPALLSKGYPASHGPAEEIATSRTTGAPVRVRSSGVVQTLWRALTLREHLWHRRDLGAHLAVIRYTGDEARPPGGLRARGWGAATADLAPDAPLSVLSVASTTDEQVAWLLREDPAYLLVYPSVLDAIVRALAARGARLPSLREVRTISEVLTDETRALAGEVLGVPVTDTYSAQEVGYIALACPDHPGYHVQAERLIVEVLDDAGRPCAAGETGRVVLTDVHNFATPILRYDIGDFAEVGAPCPCGRGLPRLTRIVGRRRNMLTYPDGRTAWPVFTVACRAAARYREVQLVQPRVDALVLRVVADQPLDGADRAALVAALHACLGHPFDVTIEEVAELRGPTGKLDELVSLVR